MIQPPHRSFALLRKDLTADQEFEGWMREVSERLNFLEPEEGIGSPEGVVFARKFKQYFDTSSDDVYTKTTDEPFNTGWKIIT